MMINSGEKTDEKDLVCALKPVIVIQSVLYTNDVENV